jgi:NAD(P)-dependent dehydrogenase (short-subunit alcohol dehydrogenase family)
LRFLRLSFGPLAERATFLAADLSTPRGVAAAAERLLVDHECFDAILHSSGMLTMDNVQTADGLNAMFAVNYLCRYHLTQLLLPALRRAINPRVVMVTAKVAMNTKIDFGDFPTFANFRFSSSSPQINAANLHYAAHLARSEPQILAGVVNAGTVRTDIMRSAPTYMRIVTKIAGPLIYIPVDVAAHNAVEACLKHDWLTGSYWGNPGKFDDSVEIDVDPKVTAQVIQQPRILTSV